MTSFAEINYINLFFSCNKSTSCSIVTKFNGPETVTVRLSVFDISDVPRSELYAKVISKRQNPIIKPIMIPQNITEKKFPTHKNKSTRLIFPILSVSAIWQSRRRKFTIMMQASNAFGKTARTGPATGSKIINTPQDTSDAIFDRPPTENCRDDLPKDPETGIPLNS